MLVIYLSDKHDQYKFTATQDWFSFNIDTWTALFSLVQSTQPRVLEIGSWEGRSAIFLLNNLCKDGGDITCIDHFDLMQTLAGRERYEKIQHNLSLTTKPFRVLAKFSFPALVLLLEEEMTAANPGFDWVYVDGSHEADDTFLDGELVWRLARKGAVIIFDDYYWDKEPEESIHHPRRGVDAFMALHEGEYDILSIPSQYQMILRKNTEMRIGFLVEGKADDRLADTLEYGINLALAVDDSYAMAAAVAIRSAVDHTNVRLTVYIVDCGLSTESREKITSSLPERRGLTLKFLDLPSTSVTATKGATWAKVDMIAVLPVERVLYLDADTIVRGDLAEIWGTDLQGQNIAAVIDIGYPMGHDGIARRPYFNAGVLLMDLAGVREGFPDLQKLANAAVNLQHHDQDVLNEHFGRQILCRSPDSRAWSNREPEDSAFHGSSPSQSSTGA